MAQFNSLNVKLSNSKLHKLKLATGNATKVALKPFLNMFGPSHDEAHFSFKWLPTHIQVSKRRKAFANNQSANINLLTDKLPKTVQSAEFLGRYLRPSLKTGLLLMKSALKPVAKNVLIRLGLTQQVHQMETQIFLKNSWIGDDNINNFKLKNERHHESS